MGKPWQLSVSQPQFRLSLSPFLFEYCNHVAAVGPDLVGGNRVVSSCRMVSKRLKPSVSSCSMAPYLRTS